MASVSSITIDGQKYYFKDIVLREGIETKQDKLIAGEGIEITKDGVISLKEDKQYNSAP